MPSKRNAPPVAAGEALGLVKEGFDFANNVSQKHDDYKINVRDELLGDAAKYLIVYADEWPPAADATELPIAAETRRSFYGPKRVALNTTRVWR